MKKWILYVAGFGLCAALGIVYLLNNIGLMLQHGIEKYGTELTGVPVKLASLDISLKTGTAGASDFKMGNPKGYDSKYAFLIEQTDIKINLPSLKTDVIVIDEMTMENARIFFELAANGQNNFAIIRRHIDEYLKANPQEGDLLKYSHLKDKQIVIKNFYLRNASVVVTAPIIQAQTYQVKLSTIHLTDVGKNQGPGNASKIMSTIISDITDAVISAVGPVTLENFSRLLTNAPLRTLNNLGNDTEKALEGVGKIFTQ